MSEADRPRCQAVTKAGERCLKNAVGDSKYCGTHQDGQAIERLERTTESGFRKGLIWTIVVAIVVGGACLAFDRIYLRTPVASLPVTEEFRIASGHGGFGYGPMGSADESWGLRADLDQVAARFMVMVQEAYNALENAEYERSIELYLPILEVLPDEPILFHNLGVAQTHLQQWGPAIASYKRSIELDDTLFAVYNNLGLALSDSGLTDPAILAVKEAVRLAPDNAIIRSNLGLIYMRADSLPAAASTSREAIERDQHLIPPYLILASSLIKMEEVSSAMDTLDYVLSRGLPRVMEAEAHFYRGIAFRKLEKYNEAIVEWSISLSLDTAYYPALINKASALLALGHCDSARVFVESNINAYADSAAIYLILGNSFMCENNLNIWKFALQMYNEALTRDTCLAEAFVGLGRTMGLIGAHEIALEKFQRAIECDSSLQVAHFNAGSAMLKLEQYSGAIDYLERALDLDPQDSLCVRFLEEARSHL